MAERYAIFALGHPVRRIVSAQTPHGICYSFFFVRGMIAVAVFVAMFNERRYQEGARAIVPV